MQLKATLLNHCDLDVAFCFTVTRKHHAYEFKTGTVAFLACGSVFRNVSQQVVQDSGYGFQQQTRFIHFGDKNMMFD